MIEQFTVASIEPAQGRGPCNVVIGDGRKIAAWNGENNQLQIGAAYSADIYSKVNGNYTNWAFSKTPNIVPANGGQTPQGQSQAPHQAPNTTDRDRNRSIITQCAGKAGHASDGSFNQRGAEDFLKWYFTVMTGGWERIYAEVKGQQQPAPEPEPEPYPEPRSDLDNEIPF